MAAVFHEPHFYTPFSVGLFLIFLEVYKSVAHHELFSKWPRNKYVIFWMVVLVVSILIDIIGMKLGYWHYPGYSGSLDEIVKYIFEWCIALMYHTVAFVVGIEIFTRHGFSKIVSGILSLALFVFPIGMFTEYTNHLADSWVVTSMPFTNAQIGGYFIIFQTIGYWLMALIPWVIYVIVDHYKTIHRRKRLK